jgi:hypothetical protein
MALRATEVAEKLMLSVLYRTATVRSGTQNCGAGTEPVFQQSGSRNRATGPQFQRAPAGLFTLAAVPCSVSGGGLPCSWKRSDLLSSPLSSRARRSLLVGGGQLLQREGDRPHGSFVEVRLVAEAERRVSRFELVRALEEADDIAILGVCGHPVPGSRREGRPRWF